MGKNNSQYSSSANAALFGDERGAEIGPGVADETVAHVWFAPNNIEYHRIIEKSGIDNINNWKIQYVKYTSESAYNISSSSGDSLRFFTEKYYESIAQKLSEIECIENSAEAPVDVGAIRSAKRLLTTLKQSNLAPPGIAFQGGEAVVLMWAFNSIAWAITVTDGECGYVIRRDRKLLKMRDSIKIEKFNLIEMK